MQKEKTLLMGLSFLYGICSLLPTGAILIDMDFFIRKLPTYHPEYVYNLIASFTQLGGIAMGFVLINKITYQTKFLIAFVPTIIFMSLFPFVYLIEDDDTVWILSNLLLTLIGVFLGFMMAIVLGISGILGPQFTGLMLLGQAVSSLITLIYLRQKYLILATELRERQTTMIKEREASVIENLSQNNDLKNISMFEVKAQNPLRIHFYLKLMDKIWVESLILFINFLISYMLYPSILFQKKFELFENIQWNILMLNLGFNLGNFIGRVLARFKHGYSRLFLILTCISRGLIIASSFVIGLEDTVFLSHPATVIFNSLLVGLTGGLFSVASSTSFHQRLAAQEKEFGGYIITVMLNSGIGVGSLVSLLAFQHTFK
ncbi:equilibrative nucleoside transporter 4-like [Stylonychia lemnae]|uniref:Equilibrative nucleoside transporter 4-like n=1 Tax=Stylonychia lemnae TaxID=5949 RepID=A0A077ZRF3_STYLE|nr:equilibrative nucleoside transporter 4-like [Stylonychia lemnae]|eukprot:CDW72034.1 equilibrative nucleoside transporter 4-like [Stylonychia lemnae]